MSSKNTFLNDSYYHAANYGIENRLVFLDKKDLDRFTDLLKYYRHKNPPSRFSFRKREAYSSRNVKLAPIVEVIAYTTMPDHFHLLLKQVESGGISKFISNISNSYTKYFNSRYKRAGSLFQGTFKSSQALTGTQLTTLSAFIHMEPVRRGIVLSVNRFPFSSYPEYADTREGFCKKQPVMQAFNSPAEYHNFIIANNLPDGTMRKIFLD